jgi:glutamate receptor ionotropic, NMDA 3A
LAGGTERPEKALTASFALLNLVSDTEGKNTWRQVGRIHGRNVKLHTIVWPGGRLVAHGQSDGARTIFRIVTALAPPFVMEGELDEDGQCLRGLPCHRPQTSDRDNLTLAFNELERETVQEETDFFFPTPKPEFSRMATHCCYGLAMDLLENIAQELEFDFHLYIVEDGLYGSRKLLKPFHKLNEYRSEVNDFLDPQSYRSQYRSSYKILDEQFIYEDDFTQDEEKWNGIVGDLVSGAAHMSFAALSVSAARAEVIDYSQPYFFSGVSILAAPNQKADIPLLAFLLPFSPELWIAIFTSLNVTAIAVAIYEWLSPFGLNPWGRQRSKNFSISSALWVMWGLLCGHLVAFKAPKSWPNKFLINVWGGFSVIFVASYTANIAALIAGLFFHNAVDDYQGRSNVSTCTLFIYLHFYPCQLL